MASPPEFDLSGKVVAVTGGTGLIGRAHCEALAGAGAHVIVADINADAAASLAHHLGDSFGVECAGAGVDVTSKESVIALRDSIRARFGRLDGLINDAAINDKVESATAGPEETAFENYDYEAFRRVMDVNVGGTFVCCQLLGPDIVAQGGGSIVNVASTYGLVAPDQSLYVDDEGRRLFYKTPAYPTSKGAVLQFSRYLAAYWGKDGVRVNTLVPGGVQTAGTAPDFVERYASRTPLGRMAQADDYGGVVVYLMSDASRYMTGSAVVVDGGWTCW